jgi:RNA polymerase sigma factor (sigma-70 family)
MQQTDDNALLRQYAENQSDEAFATLVTRHVNLVYSVALRHTGNPHRAEEITQAVFIILAKKAAQLREVKALSSWLFQATHLTANNFVRSESRRHRREQEAHVQSILNGPETGVWPRIVPLLDTAVAGLREKDRQAIVLRFYEGRDLRDIGMVLGVSEDAAEKRISRALEKLRQFFTKRGVNSTTAIIAETISTNSVQFAPVALAKSVTAVALAKGAAASGSTLTLVKGALKLMAWTKAKTVIVSGVVVLLTAGTTTILIERHIEANQYTIAPEPWSDAGAATPKAVLQSLAWALTHDKIDRAQELIRWDEKGVEYGNPAIEHQIALASFLAPAVKDIESFRILSIESTKQPDETIVKFEKTFKNQNIQPIIVTAKLRRLGSQWRVVGRIEYYESGSVSTWLPFTASF